MHSGLSIINDNLICWSDRSGGQEMKMKRFTTDNGGYHGELGFYCPGCNSVHFITDKMTAPEAIANGPWAFNNDFERPKVTPSILLSRNNGNYVCHSFITDGKIQFLSDCTHHLKGQTVDLNDI